LSDAYPSPADAPRPPPPSGHSPLMPPGAQTLPAPAAGGGFSASVPVTVNDSSALGPQSGTNGVDALFESSAQVWRPEQSVDHGGRGNGAGGVRGGGVGAGDLFQGGPGPVWVDVWARY